MIQPDFMYEESELQNHLAGAFNPLTVARKEGAVKHVHAHYSTFYLGQWVIDWLQTLGTPKAEAKAAAKPAPTPPASPSKP